MIHGRFGDTTGRPYVQTRFALPQQSNNPWAYCSMIIDTGAERSVLVPVDARRMGLRRQQLSIEASTLGIGGNARGHDEFAFIALADEERAELYNFRVRVFIPEDSDDMREIDASVLGRDVLDNFRLVYDKTAGLAQLDIRRPPSGEAGETLALSRASRLPAPFQELP